MVWEQGAAGSNPAAPTNSFRDHGPCLLHGEHAGWGAVRTITAGLVVLIRKDLATFERDQSSTVANHGRIAEMYDGGWSLRPDAVPAIEKRRAAIHDKGGKHGGAARRARENAMPGIAGHNTVAHLHDDRSGADRAAGDDASEAVVLHLNAGEHAPHRA